MFDNNEFKFDLKIILYKYLKLKLLINLKNSQAQ